MFLLGAFYQLDFEHYHPSKIQHILGRYPLKTRWVNCEAVLTALFIYF